MKSKTQDRNNAEVFLWLQGCRRGLRPPRRRGEFFGMAQHGLLDLKAGHILKDFDLIESAKAVASDIINEDPELKHPVHSKLKAEVIRQYSNRLELLKIG